MQALHKAPAAETAPAVPGEEPLEPTLQLTCRKVEGADILTGPMSTRSSASAR